MNPEPLSELQLAFMQALWALKEAGVAEVQAHLLAQGRKLAPTTVATVLRRLEEKGWVKHREDGRWFRYRAAVPRDRAAKGILDRVSGALFGGDVPAMVGQLLDARQVDRDDLAAIRRLLDEKERKLK